MSNRILLDTNIFITGYRTLTSEEGQVITLLRNRAADVLLLSFPLEEQIRRVARRIVGKDWAGLIFSRLWHDFAVEYISLPDRPLAVAQALAPEIPREDLLIYLTAVVGNATLFISGNRKFLREAATQQQLFTCLTPAEFLARNIG